MENLKREIKNNLKTIKDKINYLDSLIKLLNTNRLSYIWNKLLSLNISNKDLDEILDKIIPDIITLNVITLKQKLTRLINKKCRSLEPSTKDYFVEGFLFSLRGVKW